MQVHDLLRGRAAAVSPAHHGSAIVLELREQTYVLSERPELHPWLAQRAASCLLEPCVGDRVWFVVEAGPPGQQGCFVTAVLVRDADAPAAQLSVEGTSQVRIQADSLTLHADTRLELQADDLRAQSRIARMVIGECTTVLRSLFTHASKVTLVGKLIETFADKIGAHSKVSQRTVEELDQVQAGTIDYRAQHSAQINAEQALITGTELVKVDSGQIHLG